MESPMMREWRKDPTRLTVGDTVAYSRSFLQSIGYDYEISTWRGKLLKLQHWPEYTLAYVQWNDGNKPSVIMTSNLVKVDPQKGIIDPA